MILLYFIVALGATIIGAMAGLGGGVIIKPVLDFLGGYSVSAIGVISACTVFSMSVVSIIKQVKYKFKIEVRKTIFIGIGSIIGGPLGEKLLKDILKVFPHNVVTIYQNTILAVFLILIFIYMRKKDKLRSFKINSSIVCVLIGLFLGIMSSFLSIGGGPINICVLTIFFSMSPKEAAVNSIITILFSQGSQLISIVSTRGVEAFQIPIIPIMVVGGVIGGIVGSKLNKICDDKVVLRVFNVLLILLIILNVYNITKSIA
ncbi:sulfite exporter TauE/SafE family protein [Clostridium sp. C8-1-8]|uniref:sulfite exporter TauE/SafE family protein n=1 Tax=Clostridium sp. C8-1-8 TaxID=2698831 RepID=UPI00136F7CC1|nr:sulfite exporter TauE/SafE family protein [Clostridium sp. C8-1-8]